MTWDKPENYDRVLANEAAAPYLETMATAAARSQDYDKGADALFDQARAARAAAADLEVHVHSMELHGDKLGAMKGNADVKALLAQATGLEAKAKDFVAIAKRTYDSIPKWQQAATAATAHIAARYDRHQQAEQMQQKLAAR